MPRGSGFANMIVSIGLGFCGGLLWGACQAPLCRDRHTRAGSDSKSIASTSSQKLACRRASLGRTAQLRHKITFLFPSGFSVGHNEIIGVCRVGINAEGLGRDHWNEMLAYPRKPIAHWHPLVEVKKSFKEVREAGFLPANASAMRDRAGPRLSKSLSSCHGKL